MTLVKGMISDKIICANDYVDGTVLCKRCGTQLIKQIYNDTNYFSHKLLINCDEWSHKDGKSILHVLWKSICNIDYIEYNVQNKNLSHIVDIYNSKKSIIVNIIDYFIPISLLRSQEHFCTSQISDMSIRTISVVWIMDAKVDGCSIYCKIISDTKIYVLAMIARETNIVYKMPLYYDTKYGMIRFVKMFGKFSICEVIDLNDFLDKNLTDILKYNVTDSINILTKNNLSIDNLPVLNIKFTDLDIKLTNENCDQPDILFEYITKTESIIHTQNNWTYKLPMLTKNISTDDKCKEKGRGFVYIFFNEINEFYYIGSTTIAMSNRKLSHLKKANDKNTNMKLTEKINETRQICEKTGQTINDIWHIRELDFYESIYPSDLLIKEDEYILGILNINGSNCLNSARSCASNTVIKTRNFQDIIKKHIIKIKTNRQSKQIMDLHIKLTDIKKQETDRIYKLKLINECDNVQYHKKQNIYNSIQNMRNYIIELKKKRNYINQMHYIFELFFANQCPTIY